MGEEKVSKAGTMDTGMFSRQDRRGECYKESRETRFLRVVWSSRERVGGRVKGTCLGVRDVIYALWSFLSYGGYRRNEIQTCTQSIMRRITHHLYVGRGCKRDFCLLYRHRNERQ